MSELRPNVAKVRPELFAPWSTAWPGPTAEEIRLVLIDTGITQTMMSSVLGVTARTMRRWAAGDSPMPYHSWCILADMAGVPKFWSAPKAGA